MDLPCLQSKKLPCAEQAIKSDQQAEPEGVKFMEDSPSYHGFEYCLSKRRCAVGNLISGPSPHKAPRHWQLPLKFRVKVLESRQKVAPQLRAPPHQPKDAPSSHPLADPYDLFWWGVRFLRA